MSSITYAVSISSHLQYTKHICKEKKKSACNLTRDEAILRLISAPPRDPTSPCLVVSISTNLRGKNGLFTRNLIALLILAASPLAIPLSFGADKKPAAKAAAPAIGVKTPGVVIPYALLKSEAELPAPAKPAWLFFAESLYINLKDDAIEKINAKTNKPGDPIAAVKKPCSGMVSAFTSLWVPSCGDGTLVRLDPKTGKPTATIAGGAPTVPGGIAASSDSIWILTDGKTTLSRIDPDQNAIVGEFRLPAGCRSLIFAETALWIACPSLNQVLRINAATSLIEKTIEVSEMPESIAAGEGSIWAFCKKDGKVERIDPKTNKVIKTIAIETPGLDGFITVGEGSVWVSQPGVPITRINPLAEKERVVQQFVGEGGGTILTSPGALWLADASGKLLHIDPKRVAATLAE